MDHLSQSQRVGNPSEVEVGEIDRISQLPEFIIHLILRFSCPWLSPPAELIRKSVLSKKWSDLTSSFPFLEFSIDDFTKHSRQSFFKYVEYTTSRFCHKNVTAHWFSLITTLQKPAELDTVNRCLELVLKNGVRNLEIEITNTRSRSSSLKYRLPDILLSVSMLQFLSICGCDLPSSFMVDAIMFRSLTYLRLVNIQIHDEMVQHLTTSCPLLQDLHVRNCHGFKRFCVYGHQNLQQLSITYNTQVERIDIDAPNLFDLWLTDTDESGSPPMKFSSCKKLTTVTYFGLSLPNLNGFTHFLSNFPFIKNLRMLTAFKCNNIIKLSSHSLRTLVLQVDCDFENIELNAPNLVLFICRHDYNLLQPLVFNKSWPMLRDSPYLKGCMQCYPGRYIESLWFQKLRQFLDKKNGFKVLNLYISAICSQNFTELEKVKAMKLPPYELEHIELQLDAHEKSLDYIAFVDAVLWCFRPRSLTLKSLFNLTEFKEQYEVVKFTFTKLLEQEDQRNTKIQSVGPFSPEAHKTIRDFKSFSMALPREETAMFIKQKVVL